MEVKAKLKYARTSVLKARELARLVSGKNINTALNILSINKRKSGFIIEKLLKSAVAQAEQKKIIDVDNLYIKTIAVNQGPHLRRSRPRAKGTYHLYKKKQSHIELILSER